jgi:molybdopterin-binding protein
MPAQTVTLGEAARLIGVSADTLRRWDRSGKLKTRRDSRNRRVVTLAEVRRHGGHAERHRAGDELSARNRLRGTVRSVEVDGVMGIVELEAGPFLISSVITRDAIEELGLAEGVEATAMIKATSVMLIRDDGRG